MKFNKFAAISLLSAATAFSPIAMADDSLIDLIKAGRDVVALSEIASGVDVNARTADGSTALHYATYQVNHELVNALLDAGAEADVINNFGSSPLVEAIKIGDTELVRILLEAGADPDSPNQDNQTALMIASSIGLTDIAGLLIDAGASVNAIESFRGQTALMSAAGEDNPDIVEMLLENGADVSVRAFYDDWGRQMTSEPRAQFRSTGGMTALLYATRSGCLRCTQAIVEAGAVIDRPNPDGITPLLNSLDNRNFDVAMYLIDQGADVHVWDMNGRTPIYTAVDMKSFTGGGFGFAGGQNFQVGQGGVGRGDDGGLQSDAEEVTADDVIDRLLAMDVDVNHALTRIRPNGPGRGRFADYDMRGGTSALQIAAVNNDHSSIEKLLAHGAEVNVINNFRISPLMYAAGLQGTGRRGAGGGNAERTITTIDLLLDAGADINMQIEDSYTFSAKLDTYIEGRDQEGRTALFGAAEVGNVPVVEHLLSRGADPFIEDAHGNTALDVAQEGSEAIGVLLAAMNLDALPERPEEETEAAE